MAKAVGQVVDGALIWVIVKQGRILAEKERDRLLSIIEDAPDFIATDVRALFFHQENGDRHRPIHVKNDHRKKHARRSYCPQC